MPGVQMGGHIQLHQRHPQEIQALHSLTVQRGGVQDCTPAAVRAVFSGASQFLEPLWEDRVVCNVTERLASRYVVAGPGGLCDGGRKHPACRLCVYTHTGYPVNGGAAGVPLPSLGETSGPWAVQPRPVRQRCPHRHHLPQRQGSHHHSHKYSTSALCYDYLAKTA